MRQSEASEANAVVVGDGAAEKKPYIRPELVEISVGDTRLGFGPGLDTIFLSSTSS